MDAQTDADAARAREPADNTRFSYLLAVLWAVAEARANDIEGVRGLVNRVPGELVRTRGYTAENYAESFNKRIIGVPRDEFYALVLSALQGDSTGLEAQIRKAPSYSEYLRSKDGAESRLADCMAALRGNEAAGRIVEAAPDDAGGWTRLVDDCRVRVEAWEGVPSLLVNSVGGGTVRNRGVGLLLRGLADAPFEVRAVGYHPSGKAFQALPQSPDREQMRQDGDAAAKEIFRALGRIEGGNQGSRFRVVLARAELAAVREWLVRLATRRDPVPPVSPPSPPALTLREAVPAVHAALEAAGWVYEPWQIAAYITALRTKPFVILGGVSGTGKSELPGLVNQIIGGAAHKRVSVRPDWTDSADLLGYRDLNRQFCPGDLALAARAARDDSERFHVCVIDEMNIARVEHYFAEVLSAIEDRGDVGGGSGTLLSAHLANNEPDLVDLRIPGNMALVGTVNMDESTFGFSKKVLDRAFTIELSSVDLGKWRRGGTSARASVPVALSDLTRARRRLSDLSCASNDVGQRIDGIIRDLVEVNTLLAPAQLHLGYRSRDEIVLFVLNAEEVLDSFKAADGTSVDPVDLALMMKVLPRISGGSRTVRASLAQLLCWTCSRADQASPEEAATTFRDEWAAAGRPATFAGKRFPRTAARLCLMWDRMVEEGFTSFWI